MGLRLPLRLLASLTVVLAGCSRCGPPPPPPPASPVDAGERLTEVDTDKPVDRTVTGLDGGAWTLRVPTGDWRVVKPGPTQRVMATRADRWLVSPSLDAHVIVRCAEAPLGKSDLNRFPALAEGRVTALGRTFVLQSTTPVAGPWLEGLELTYQAKAGPVAWQYVHRVIAQLTRVCEVQGWSLADALAAPPELEQIVRSFTPTSSPADRAVSEVFHLLQEPRVKASLAALGDAGVKQDFAALVLAGEGIARLPDELLDERFRLRLALLQRSPPDVCGGLIRQLQDPLLLLAALDTLSEAEADRWAAISKAAILAQVEGSRVRLPDDKAVEAARQVLIKSHPDMASALAALKAIDLQSNLGLCDAERARLTQAFTLDLKTRVVLFRDWLGR